MVAPQMPGRRPVRQAVLDDQADRQGHHAARVVALGHREVVHVGVEVRIAPRTAVLGVRDVKIAGLLRDRVPQVVQRPLHASEPIGIPPATRTPPAPVIPASSDDPGLWEVFDPSDPFGCIGNVLTGLWHGDVPPVARLPRRSSPIARQKSSGKLCNDATVSEVPKRCSVHNGEEHPVRDRQEEASGALQPWLYRPKWPGTAAYRGTRRAAVEPGFGHGRNSRSSEG